MEKCPVCNSELKTKPKKYNKTPDDEFLVATLYECSKDGVFALLLGSEDILSSNELAKLRAIQYLRPLDGKLRILSVSCDSKDIPHIICKAYPL